MAARIAMIAMTTRSSMSVNAFLRVMCFSNSPKESHVAEFTPLLQLFSTTIMVYDLQLLFQC